MSRLRTWGYPAAAIAIAAIAFVFGTHWEKKPAAQPAPHVQQAPGEPPGSVIVAPEAQQQSGLETATPAPTVLHPTASAYAVALDVRPLLAARRQASTAQAEARAAERAERVSRDEYERARKLFADDRNVSQKAMQAAEAAWRAAQGKLQAATAALHESQATALQQFGPVLAAGTAAPSADIERLAARREGLVQVVLPASSAQAAPATITLSAPGYPTSRAQRISASPQGDPAAAGRPFLYRSEATYPSGLRLQADVPLAGSAVPGFLMPESAVVWYGNEPWVFVQSAGDRFVRKALKDAQATPGGVFTATSFGAQERVVTRGAQLLQSEALKPKTPASAACADPECD